MRGNYINLFTLIFTFVLLLQIGCQEQAKTPEQPVAALVVPEADQTEPKIKFENVVYDFGEVPPGKKQFGQFKFTNTGEGLLKITEVKRCCGIVAKLASDKKEYSPGESGTLQVEYRSARRAITFSRKIYVLSNDKEKPNVALTIKAKVVPKVAYQPQRLQLLLKGENAGCPEITLTSLDDQHFAPLGKGLNEFQGFRSCLIESRPGSGLGLHAGTCIQDQNRISFYPGGRKPYGFRQGERCQDDGQYLNIEGQVLYESPDLGPASFFIGGPSPQIEIGDHNLLRLWFKAVYQYEDRD